MKMYDDTVSMQTDKAGFARATDTESLLAVRPPHFQYERSTVRVRVLCTYTPHRRHTIGKHPVVFRSSDGQRGASRHNQAQWGTES